MQIPSFNGNWVDLVIIIFVFSFVVSGLNRGFLNNFVDLAGFLISFFSALKFYPLAAKIININFSIPISIANALGFIFLGFLSETVFFILVRFFYITVPKALLESKINKILGPLPAVLNGLIVTSFLLAVIISLPIQPTIKKAIFNSKIGSPLVAVTQSLEQELSSIFGKAVLDTLSFITITPESTEKIDLQFRTEKTTIDEQSEETMFVLVNEERKKIGLSPLSDDFALKKVARNHAQDMFKRGYFSHINPDNQSPFDRLEAEEIEFGAAGENLAFAPTVILAHQGLMRSPKHKENILSEDFHKVGIGVVDAGVYGKMFVQLFTD